MFKTKDILNKAKVKIYIYIVDTGLKIIQHSSKGTCYFPNSTLNCPYNDLKYTYYTSASHQAQKTEVRS